MSTTGSMDRDTAARDTAANTIELLWGLREPSSRGPKPNFTIGDIARAAVKVADADGIAAVSMQRVASDLGYTKMSLYRYVTGKAELLAVMIEEAIGPPPDMTAVAGGWRRRAETWAQLLWETWDRHPWIPAATTGPRPIGPREVGWVEAAMAAFADTRLQGVDKMNAVVLLSGHVRNTHSPAAAGSQPWTAAHRLDPVLAPLIRAQADQFPGIIAATDAPGSGQEDTRQFGLVRILDGLELLMSALD
jgi:AcrR family transcriptional regulator